MLRYATTMVAAPEDWPKGIRLLSSKPGITEHYVSVPITFGLSYEYTYIRMCNRNNMTTLEPRRLLRLHYAQIRGDPWSRWHPEQIIANYDDCLRYCIGGYYTPCIQSNERNIRATIIYSIYIVTRIIYTTIIQESNDSMNGRVRGIYILHCIEKFSINCHLKFYWSIFHVYVS